MFNVIANFLARGQDYIARIEKAGAIPYRPALQPGKRNDPIRVL
jgi:hypothetical protein